MLEARPLHASATVEGHPMLDRLRQFLSIRDQTKSPQQVERDGFIDAIIEGKRQRHFATWAEKQRHDPSNAATQPELRAIHSRNFGQLEHGLREQYASLPVEDLRLLAEHSMTHQPSATKEPSHQYLEGTGLDSDEPQKRTLAESKLCSPALDRFRKGMSVTPEAVEAAGERDNTRQPQKSREIEMEME